ncbi:MAG: hypothetical protein JSW64_07305 [Candidatus Zixiibacteriota bacterium]|nr:MAG: hypothetical protein JSW64_07305 [candidate division Zixibacteria bacterium]
MDHLRDLATRVFTCDGSSLNNELLEDLEYGVFELIGRYTATAGGDRLLKSIKKTIIRNVIDIFADTKRRWNLNNFKITESIEQLDPFNDLIKSRDKEYPALDELYPEPLEIQARKALETMTVFARKKFRGDKNKKIAVKILENPDRFRDFPWIADLAGTSVGSAKVTLTRIKQTLARNFSFKRMDGILQITQIRDSAK